MLVFQQKFNNSVFYFKSNDKIHMDIKRVKTCINKYGRNCYFILCCYVYAGRPIFRYVNKQLELCLCFSGEYAYVNKSDAEADMEKLIGKHPNKVFEVVELSHIENT